MLKKEDFQIEQIVACRNERKDEVSLGKVIDIENSLITVVLLEQTKALKFRLKDSDFPYLFQETGLNQLSEYVLFPDEEVCNLYLKNERKFNGIKEYLYEKYPIINKLMNERIIGLDYSLSDESWYIFEACNNYYAFELTESNCLELSILFNDMSNILKNSK